jgi:hypothetical protein
MAHVTNAKKWERRKRRLLNGGKETNAAYVLRGSVAYSFRQETFLQMCILLLFSTGLNASEKRIFLVQFSSLSRAITGIFTTDAGRVKGCIVAPVMHQIVAFMQRSFA